MPSELQLVLPIGLLWVPIMAWLLYRLDTGRTVASWLCAWLALWFGAVLVAVTSEESLSSLVANGLFGLFSTLTLLGTWAMQKRPAPRALIVATAAALVASVIVHWLDPVRGRQAAAGLGVLFLTAAAIRVLRSYTLQPRGPDVGIAERALGPAFGGMAVLASTVGSMLVPEQPKYGLIGLWVALSGCTVLVQLLVLAERARRRERRLREERGILHRVALAGADLQDPRGAFVEALSEVQYLESFLAFGVWSVAGSADHELEWVAGHLPEGIDLPESLKRPRRDRPILRDAVASDEPLFFDHLSSDPRVTDAVRSTGLEGGFVAPLRLGDELIGVMGALLQPDQHMNDDGRRFVADLADEAAVVLAALRLREEEAQRRRALAAERRILRATCEAVPEGIVLTNADRRIELVNRHAAEVLGIDDIEEWKGRPGLELVARGAALLDEESFAIAREKVSAAAGNQKRPIPDFDLRLNDGRIVSLTASPAMSSEGEPLGRVSVVRDVTDERLLAERIGRAQRMEVVGTLAGGLAHDFNNQLTAILGIADRLVGKLDSGTEARDGLEEIITAAEHCAGLTHGLLTIAHRQPADPTPVELSKCVARIESLIRPGFPTEVDLRIRVAEDAGWALADEVQLQRVLTNLLANARDAVGPRGFVMLDVSRRTEPGGPDRIEIRVADDGPGMDEATRRQVFDPFFTTKASSGGTGLGLSVVYGIVDAHGGRIEVESAVGTGTEFRIEWPAAEPLEEIEPPEPHRAGRRAARGTVLVAEDEAMVRRVVTAALQEVGFEVIAVEDGETAIEVFERPGAHFDAALLDLSMPGRSGLEVLAALRAHTPELPAAVMSGDPARSSDRKLDEVPLLHKPFRLRDVQQLIEQLLPEHRVDL